MNLSLWASMGEAVFGAMHLAVFEAVTSATRVFAAAAVAGLWQGVVLAAVAALGLRLVPRTPATVRFFVWVSVLAGAAGLPFVHVARVGSTMGERGVRVGIGWSLAIAGVWVAVTVWRLGVLAEQAVRLMRIWREARPVRAEAEIAAVLGSLALRRVELCVSAAAEVDRPSVIGFFRPRVLIPAWLFAQLTEAELRQIVLHEVEHLRRGDDWLNLVQKLSLAVFPLNPALVWVERRLCLERELACDDGVLRVTSSPTAYARCLTTLAERGLGRRMASALVLGALGRRSELARRVYGILEWQPVLSPARSRTIAALLVVGLAGAGTELARAPELVSFAGPSAAGSAEMQEVGADRVLGGGNSAKAVVESKDVVFSADRKSKDLAEPRMSLLEATLPSGPVVSGDGVAVRAAVAPRVAGGARLVKTRGSVADGRAVAARAMVARGGGGVLDGTTGDFGEVDAPEGDRWVVLTSFAWSEDGQSGTVVRRAEFVSAGGRSDAAAAGSSFDNGRVGVDGIVFRREGVAAPASNFTGVAAPALAQPRQVLIRYAAVPTDLGWLFVQL